MSRVSRLEINRCGVCQKASMASSGLAPRRLALLKTFTGLYTRDALEGGVRSGLSPARQELSLAVGCVRGKRRSGAGAASRGTRQGGTLEKPADRCRGYVAHAHATCAKGLV